MARFKKGEGGRPKGAANKLTKSAREAFALAFDALGGAEQLALWAVANPTEFYKLYARLIPVEHVGQGGEGPIQTIVKHFYESGPRVDDLEQRVAITHEASSDRS